MRLLDSTSQLLPEPGSFRSNASGKTGSGPKLNTAKLKNTMTTSGGVLRNPSTKTCAIRATSQLLDSRATPTISPTMEASSTPTRPARNVFCTPISTIRQMGRSGSNPKFSGMANPVGWVRKSKSVGMRVRVRFSTRLPYSHHPARQTPATSAACQIADRNPVRRHQLLTTGTEGSPATGEGAFRLLSAIGPAS